MSNRSMFYVLAAIYLSHLRCICDPLKLDNMVSKGAGHVDPTKSSVQRSSEAIGLRPDIYQIGVKNIKVIA